MSVQLTPPPIGIVVRVIAIIVCAFSWTVAAVSCANHYSRSEEATQEAFVSYRGCASCASLAARLANAVTLTAGR